MKKLLLIPILALAMGFSMAPFSTPEANAKNWRHRGYGHYKHHRHHRHHRKFRHHRRHHSRHYRHYRHYDHYRPYRHHRYNHHRDTNFFLGLSFPGLFFGASHFDVPHNHGPWCYR